MFAFMFWLAQHQILILAAAGIAIGAALYFVAGILTFFQTPLGRAIAIAVAVAAAFVFGDLRGFRKAAEACRENNALMDAAAARRDADAAREAAQIASEETQEAQRHAATLEGKVREYEAALAKAQAGRARGACRLDRGDLGRLRDIR